MSITPTIVPSVWCDGTADEAADFYAAVIPGAAVGERVDYPTEGLLDFQQHMAGKPITIEVNLPDLRICLINAGS